MSDEFGPSFITLTDEDGNDIELEYVDALEHEGQTYMAFFPAVEDEADEESEDYGLVILKSVTENGEELLSTLDRRKNIRVRDRATLFNLAVGLNGYTVCSGVISHELNGENIISVPLDVDETMTIGIITRRNTTPTRYGKAYREAIKRHIPQSA